MKRVLLIDDSMMMRITIEQIVKSSPEFEVVGSAGNGQEGLDMVKSCKPDAILLDLEMPVMNGLEFLKRIKLISKAKVIVLSSIAQAGSKQAVQAREFGAADVIDKPSGTVSVTLQSQRGNTIITALKNALGME